MGVRVGSGESVTPTVESVVLDESDTLEEGRREETEDVEEVGTASLDADRIVYVSSRRPSTHVPFPPTIQRKVALSFVSK